MSARRRVFIGPAWPYANGPRHVGHVAGFGLPADVAARHARMRGDDVLMVSGTDEHGTPITLAADREGVPPRAIADRYNAVIADDLRRLGLSYNLFTRTTTATHHRTVQDVFRALYNAGHIARRAAPGAFDRRTGRTLPDRYIEGECPECGAPDARGDQCDACGRQLDPQDLVRPRSTVDGSVPVFRETEHFFLDLPSFAGQLGEWIARHEQWRRNVRGATLAMLADLKPRAVTRDLDWGVPIPVPGFAERADKRIYVWFDAVVGYLSASVEWSELSGRPEAWRDWWQDPAARHLYFLGKDNIVFHTLIWPALLTGYHDGELLGLDRRPLALPDEVVASEFLTMEGRRFSSSRGIVVYVGDVLSRHDPDLLRYYLAAAGPETQDADFTWEEFVRRGRDELVGKWGNLAHRTLTLAHRAYGRVPEPGVLEPRDHALLAEVAGAFDVVGSSIEGHRLRAATQELMAAVGAANRYVAAEAPWRLLREDPERARTVLHVALQAVADLHLLSAPFMPFSSCRLHELLGYDDVLTGFSEAVDVDDGHGRHRVLRADPASWTGRWHSTPLPVGRPLPAPHPLFTAPSDRTAAAELERLRPPRPDVLQAAGGVASGGSGSSRPKRAR